MVKAIDCLHTESVDYDQTEWSKLGAHVPFGLSYDGCAIIFFSEIKIYNWSSTCYVTGNMSKQTDLQDRVCASQSYI